MFTCEICEDGLIQYAVTDTSGEDFEACQSCAEMLIRDGLAETVKQYQFAIH